MDFSYVRRFSAYVSTFYNSKYITLGKNQLKVKDQINHVRQVHIMDVKKTIMPEVIVKAIPDYKQFGRAAKLRLYHNNIGDLG